MADLRETEEAQIGIDFHPWCYSSKIYGREITKRKDIKSITCDFVRPDAYLSDLMCIHIVDHSYYICMYTYIYIYITI